MECCVAMVPGSAITSRQKPTQTILLTSISVLCPVVRGQDAYSRGSCVLLSSSLLTPLYLFLPDCVFHSCDSSSSFADEEIGILRVHKAYDLVPITYVPPGQGAIGSS